MYGTVQKYREIHAVTNYLFASLLTAVGVPQVPIAQAMTTSSNVPVAIAYVPPQTEQQHGECF